MQELIQWLKYSWDLALEASPYLLFGLIISGFMKALVPDSLVKKALGGPRLPGILKGALIGTPIPLCSCGVLPVVQILNKQGARRPASLAFLVATPENGADSFVMTWGMLGFPYAIIRVIAGFLSAVAVGVVDLFFPEENLPADPASGCCPQSTCSSKAKRPSLKESMLYAFTDLMDDIGPSLLGGLLLGGAILLLLPSEFTQKHLSGGILGMLAVLAASAPLYLCATSSTPLAVGLILQGMSPGTALVMLLAGPATNAASLAVVLKLFGPKATLRYLITLCAMAILMGLGTDALLTVLNLSISPVKTLGEHHQHSNPLQILSALIVIGLCLKPLLRSLRPHKDDCCH